jgi:hypothetical protein
MHLAPAARQLAVAHAPGRRGPFVTRKGTALSPGHLLTSTPKKLRRVIGIGVAAAFALVMTGVIAPGASAGAVTPAPLTTQAWHQDIAKLATPASGCYSASFPALSWHSVACAAAPDLRFAPSTGAAKSASSAESAYIPVGRGTKTGPETVGLQWDHTAVVTGLLKSAIGTFPTVNGVTSEEGAGVANAYSLQLNSAPFTTPACEGHGSSCKGWEQFVLSNPADGEPSSILTQFWLLNYTGACPADWDSFEGDYCYTDGPDEEVPTQPIGNLSQLSLTGSVTATSDTTVLTTPSTSYTVAAPDSMLELSKQWNTVEFLLGGDGGGTEAVFNSGSTLVAQTATNNGTTEAPTCILDGFSGETNSLNLVETPPFSPGPLPAIQSKESNVNITDPSCATAQGVGDTHLETFGGTFYDFQAQGTFTLAENANMTVQNEQVSGAPNWPNAAVNAAVGAQMGTDTFALCGSGAVYLDDTEETLAPGESETLDSGDVVSRSGDTYTVTDPQGDSVIATWLGTYVDVQVGLGQYPEAVSGLLANAPGTDNELETSTGEIIDTPVDLGTLYGTYGDSWRVPPTGSLVSVCDDPTPNEDPTTPFWADELTPAQQSQGEAACEQDGVTNQTLLEACTLDVAVLGTAAATDYEGDTAPVDVGYSEDTSGSGSGSSPSPSP